MTRIIRHQLENGLKVLIHPDPTTRMAVVNVIYNVGARDESEEKTGFAHLFEHLMFEGSVNIPNYDEPLQRAGGNSNAFTNNDLTNYYQSLPAANLETALWLESDRMLSLGFSQEKLDIQKSVVCEEFREHYINQPYGNVWHLLSELCYKKHPYKWPTIGKELAHVEAATMDDVRGFFKRFYHPANACLLITGGVDPDKALELAKKWFADIEPGALNRRELPQEAVQTAARRMNHHGDVPTDSIYMAFPMAARMTDDFYSADLLSDVLSGGTSSRLYRRLLKEEKLFSQISSWVSGTIDPGLFVVEGRLSPGCDFKQAEEAIWNELTQLTAAEVDDRELLKVQNKSETYLAMNNLNLMNRTIELAIFELMDRAEAYDEEIDRLKAVSTSDIRSMAQRTFAAEKANVLYYHAERPKA